MSVRRFVIRHRLCHAAKAWIVVIVQEDHATLRQTRHEVFERRERWCVEVSIKTDKGKAYLKPFGGVREKAYMNHDLFRIRHTRLHRFCGGIGKIHLSLLISRFAFLFQIDLCKAFEGIKEVQSAVGKRQVYLPCKIPLIDA